MKPVNKKQITSIVIHFLGTALLTGIILAVDFLYAGVQERLFENIYPEYEPNLALANKVIIASSVSIFIGLLFYVIIAWYVTRSEKILQKVREEQIIDSDGSFNFKAFQYEIPHSLKVLRDLFIYIIGIVIIAGLFMFLRFVWIFSKYRSYNQLFIEYFLTNVSSMIISITLYLALGFMINYVVITSLQKYCRLQLISKSYDEAMQRVLENFDRLMEGEDETK
ncbi:MAG: hypothetical protein FK731_12775 [Asgard group archaeon]|nr:hypothetical protein [Asgard group archaeon]